MSIFDWFFSKEEKEYYVSPLELLEDRIEIMEKDHLIKLFLINIIMCQIQLKNN